MHEHPHDPRGKAAQPDPVPAEDGAEAPDGGDAAEVAVAERLGLLVAAQAAADRVRGVQAALHRDLGDTGQVVEAGHVADREHLGMAGQREVGQHLDPPGTVDLGPARLREHAREWRRLHARRPDDRAGGDALGRAVLRG